MSQRRLTLEFLAKDVRLINAVTNQGDDDDDPAMDNFENAFLNISTLTVYSNK